MEISVYPVSDRQDRTIQKRAEIESIPDNWKPDVRMVMDLLIDLRGGSCQPVITASLHEL